MGGNNFHTNVRFFNELVFTRKGQVPTVPILLNLTQQSPLWKQATDLNDGEWAVNNKDNIVFIRIYDKIISFNISELPNVIDLSHQRLHALDSVLDHSSTIKPGDLMDADENGLPHDSGITTASVNNIINASSGIKFQIESGEVVKVDNDYQYLLRDHLYLNGGTIQLNGNAEMIIF
jgi:hypothetical protein